jgi:hypothetical protein
MNTYKISLKILTGREDLKDLGIDKMIILKWILEKYGCGSSMCFTSLKIWAGGGLL